MLGKMLLKPLEWFSYLLMFAAKLIYWLWLVLSPTLLALLIGGVLFLASDEYGIYLFYGTVAVGVVIGIWWAESVRRHQYGLDKQEDVEPPSTPNNTH